MLFVSTHCPGCAVVFFFFFNDTATTEIYTLSLHDALPICQAREGINEDLMEQQRRIRVVQRQCIIEARPEGNGVARSEEHTSELQSRLHLVCRLLLEKKKASITGFPHRSADLRQSLDNTTS